MKITKKKLFDFCNENNDAINELQSQSDSTDFALAVLIQQLKDSGVIDEISPEPKPQLKQLDQSDDTAKELLEVDLSSELTGSELCRAMLARGDRWILCGNTTDGFASPCVIDGYRCSEDDLGFVLTNGKSIEPRYIYPVNNQGEPLTAADVGL